MDRRVFSVLYNKASTRKHKKYPFGGTFETLQSNRGKLLDADGMLLTEGSLESGVAEAAKSLNEFYFNNYDIQCYEEINTNKALTPPMLNKSTPVIIEKPSTTTKKSTDSYVILAPCEKYPNGVEISGTLAKVMREHQKLGVEFLFNALQETDSGAILADDMGLGKTLQSVALIHTMFNTKNNNNYKLVRRVLILCPLSLRQNWFDEFNKWGLRNFCYIPSSKLEVERFIAISQRTPVCILNYNIVSSYHDILKMSKFDLMICDEGHILKNATKVRRKLLELQARRRLILTGTPIQNSLKEFFELTNFVNCKLFDSQEDFVNQLSKKKEAAFSQYFLRRTAEVNQKNLPPRHDFLIFCQPSSLQVAVYEKALDVLCSSSFTTFNALRQICNHPTLLLKNLRTAEYIDFARCIYAFPSDYDDFNLRAADSGKLWTLAMMVVNFRSCCDKSVVVSMSLQSLTMISILLTTLKFKVFRLDGQTDPKKRQNFVNDFNNSQDPNDIFLLSTNAGGVGLNLIGANRLIMFDCSWNPAIDFQAMARTWREGQKKKVFIYRLFTAGTVEEKFLQCQIKKTGIASVINPWVTWKNKDKTFDPVDLKGYDDFTPGALCDTHDMIGCQCSGNGVVPDDSEILDYSDKENDFDEVDDVDMDDCEDSDDIEEMPEDEALLHTRKTLDHLKKWRHHCQGSESFAKILPDCGLFEEAPVSFIMDTEFTPPNHVPLTSSPLKDETQTDNTSQQLLESSTVDVGLFENAGDNSDLCNDEDVIDQSFIDF